MLISSNSLLRNNGVERKKSNNYLEKKTVLKIRNQINNFNEQNKIDNTIDNKQMENIRYSNGNSKNTYDNNHYNKNNYNNFEAISGFENHKKISNLKNIEELKDEISIINNDRSGFEQLQAKKLFNINFARSENSANDKLSRTNFCKGKEKINDDLKAAANTIQNINNKISSNSSTITGIYSNAKNSNNKIIYEEKNMMNNNSNKSSYKQTKQTKQTSNSLNSLIQQSKENFISKYDDNNNNNNISSRVKFENYSLKGANSNYEIRDKDHNQKAINLSSSISSSCKKQHRHLKSLSNKISNTNYVNKKLEKLSFSRNSNKAKISIFQRSSDYINVNNSIENSYNYMNKSDHHQQIESLSLLNPNKKSFLNLNSFQFDKNIFEKFKIKDLIATTAAADGEISCVMSDKQKVNTPLETEIEKEFYKKKQIQTIKPYSDTETENIIINKNKNNSINDNKDFYFKKDRDKNCFNKEQQKALLSKVNSYKENENENSQFQLKQRNENFNNLSNLNFEYKLVPKKKNYLQCKRCNLVISCAGNFNFKKSFKIVSVTNCKRSLFSSRKCKSCFYE